MSEDLYVALLTRQLFQGETLLGLINRIPPSVPLQSVRISVPWFEMMVDIGAEFLWDEGTLIGRDGDSLLSIVNSIPDEVALQDVRASIPYQVEAEGDEITLEYDYHASREELEKLGAQDIRHATGKDSYE